MSRRRPAEESLLFDLPLDTAPAEPTRAAPTPEEPLDQPALPLTEAEAEDLAEVAAAAETAERSHSAAKPETAPPIYHRRYTRRSPRATLRTRLAAGLTDLGVCAAVMVVLLVALLAQGVRPTVSDWPAAALFLLSFSFLYSVLPLAFWGRTPGMALCGLRATSTDRRPLSFRQAALKWLGSVLTVAFLGLPLLLALGGRSLSDLLSGSTTRLLDRAD